MRNEEGVWWGFWRGRGRGRRWGSGQGRAECRSHTLLFLGVGISNGGGEEDAEEEEEGGLVGGCWALGVIRRRSSARERRGFR